MGILESFFDVVDVAGLRLTRPRKFIFLCGGILDKDVPIITSAREGFLRSLKTRRKFGAHDIVLAEQIDTFYPDSPYENLIEFEIDIALITDLLVLFCEGFGSLAELGAFSQIDEIAERMMVIIQSVYYGEKSFIRDGPIRHLEQRYEKSVQVFNWTHTNNGGVFEVDRMSFDEQVDDMKSSICDRLEDMPDRMGLKTDNFGHKIILVSGVADVLGAATFDDFKKAFERMGVQASDKEIRRAMFCAHAVGWLLLEKRGHQKFYLPAFETRPCDFSYKVGVRKRDTTRWKRDIRAYWSQHDKLRSHLISDVPREEAAR